ncbi:MAG: hypothetical protein ACHRHE_14595 [Tepidisphaerales bacterium]
MDKPAPDKLATTPVPAGTPAVEPPFGMNEMRLTGRQWLITAAILLVCLLATPRLWKKVERFDTGPDYRIPYTLSKDYWLYERRLEQITDPSQVAVLGDSVVWGEYVQPAGTFSHFLGSETGPTGAFVNCGVNGLFPLALEGLVESYGGALRNRKIILHCNVLWMSSPKADLRVQKEETFNHSRLVPQCTPRIPCYRADASERLSVIIERNVGFSAWVGHIQNTYYDQRSIPAWTLQDDGGSPPIRPNAWRNPLKQITMVVPGEAADDPQRGPRSPRHKPWNHENAEPSRFDWVPLDDSLQWQAFQRVVGHLRSRGNDVLVVVGPFNEHMVAADQRPTYRAMRDGIAAWLAQNRVAFVVPDTLPSELYADASHPLTDGYALLARNICRLETFRQWLARSSAP